MDEARRKLIRERMAQQRFVPLQDGSLEASNAHALDHIAFYLCEIEQHLAVIARSVERSAPNVDKLSDLVEDVLKR